MKRQGILGLDRRGGMSKQCFCNFSFQSAQMFIVSRVPPANQSEKCLEKKRVRSDRSKNDRLWDDRHSGHSQDSEFFSTCCARSRAANLDPKARI
jgi:hypothetical protein